MRCNLSLLGCFVIVGLVLGLTAPSMAQPNCVPFQASGTTTFTPQNGALFSLETTGTVTIDGVSFAYTGSGSALFLALPPSPQEVRFISRGTLVIASEGTISTMEQGSSTTTESHGSYTITGGTGTYVGATGSGSFDVVVDSAGNPISMSQGNICLPPDGNK